MNTTDGNCPHCGGPVVRVPACRWCGMVIATTGESADRLRREEARATHDLNELLKNFGGVGLHDYRFGPHGGAVAFTWEADIYCADCTGERFGEPEDPVSPWLDVTDSEGNPVGAVFPFDEFDYRPHCGRCRIPLDVAVIDETDQMEEYQ